MIPASWFLWIIVSGAATSLLGPPKVWDKVDYNVGFKSHKSRDARCRVWPAARFGGVLTGSAASARETGTCKSVSAIFVCNETTRLKVDNEEQLLDRGWTISREVVEDDELVLPYEFLNPEGGAVLQSGKVSLKCRRPPPKEG